MSGFFIFGETSRSLFRTFLKNYLVVLNHEEFRFIYVFICSFYRL